MTKFQLAFEQLVKVDDDDMTSWPDKKIDPGTFDFSGRKIMNNSRLLIFRGLINRF